MRFARAGSASRYESENRLSLVEPVSLTARVSSLDQRVSILLGLGAVIEIGEQDELLDIGTAHAACRRAS